MKALIPGKLSNLLIESYNPSFKNLNQSSVDSIKKEIIKANKTKEGNPIISKIVYTQVLEKGINGLLINDEFYFLEVKLNKGMFGIPSDQRTFILCDSTYKIVGYFSTSSKSNGLPVGYSKSRTVETLKVLDNSNEEEIIKIFYSILEDKFHITSSYFAFNLEKCNDKLISYLVKDGFTTKLNGYLFMSRKEETHSDQTVQTKVPNKAPDIKKNDSESGSRDWQQKSSGRKDGMPGGNKTPDYVRKGDHGQAGLDVMFKGFDKAADYIFNKEASKKYRV